MSSITETEIKSMSKEQNYLKGYSDGKSDVLKQIEAEVMQYNRCPSHYPVDMISIATILHIIDKHKTKSKNIEVQTANRK